MSTHLPPDDARRALALIALSSRRRRLAALAALLGGFGAFAAAPAVYADATVVTVVTVSSDGSSGPLAASISRANPKTDNITTFYKGHKVRVESGHGILIVDGDTGRAFNLDPKKKTYSSANEEMANLGSFMSKLKLTPTAVVKPTGKTRTICGRTATEYAYASTVEMGIDPSMLPESARKKGDTTINLNKLMTLKILGKTWVTSIPSLPNGGDQAMRAQNILSGAGMRGLQLITDKLSAIRGVPLDGTQSMSMELSLPGAAGADGSKSQFQYTTTTSSVKESTLSESLFEVPAGYKLVKPAMPAMPPNTQ